MRLPAFAFIECLQSSSVPGAFSSCQSWFYAPITYSSVGASKFVMWPFQPASAQGLGLHSRFTVLVPPCGTPHHYLPK
jgi:hypothetical protein